MNWRKSPSLNHFCASPSSASLSLSFGVSVFHYSPRLTLKEEEEEEELWTPRGISRRSVESWVLFLCTAKLLFSMKLVGHSFELNCATSCDRKNKRKNNTAVY